MQNFRINRIRKTKMYNGSDLVGGKLTGVDFILVKIEKRQE